MNRTIKIYPAFDDFYGMEETIERIVGFFRHAAQGLEERKQILYLLGPVGGGKSSLAERLKLLMENEPIYALKAGDEISPVFESPLGLFDPERMGPMLEDRYGIPRRRLTGTDDPLGASSVSTNSAATSRNSPWCGCRRRGCSRSASPRPSPATRTTRTSPPGRQGRYPQAGNVQPERSRRLQLLGRAQSDHPGSARIRRDVQGADQDAASAADRDAGGQLRRHREYRRHPVSAASSWRTRTRPNGRASRTTRTTKPSSTASRSSRCRTACAPPRSARSTKSCCRAASCRMRRAPRRRWTSCRGSACCRG